MPHTVTLIGQEQRYPCDRQASVLSAVSSRGSGPVKVGCRGGGCGVCRIRVVEGEYRTGGMNRELVTEAEQARGVSLACQTFPVGDLSIEVLGPVLRQTRGDTQAECFARFLSVCQRR